MKHDSLHGSLRHKWLVSPALKLQPASDVGNRDAHVKGSRTARSRLSKTPQLARTPTTHHATISFTALFAAHIAMSDNFGAMLKTLWNIVSCIFDVAFFWQKVRFNYHMTLHVGLHTSGLISCRNCTRGGCKRARLSCCSNPSPRHACSKNGKLQHLPSMSASTMICGMQYQPTSLQTITQDLLISTLQAPDVHQPRLQPSPHSPAPHSPL